MPNTLTNANTKYTQPLSLLLSIELTLMKWFEFITIFFEYFYFLFENANSPNIKFEMTIKMIFRMRLHSKKFVSFGKWQRSLMKTTGKHCVYIIYVADLNYVSMAWCLTYDDIQFAYRKI